MIASLALHVALVATTFVPYRTSSGVPLRWDAEAILELHVGATPDGALPVGRVTTIAEAALATWLEASCPDPTRVDLRPDAIVVPDGGTLDEGDGLVGLVWIPDRDTWNQRYGTTELARTILIHRSVSGEIVDADVVVNLGSFLFAADEACAADRYDLASTLTHELGHVLGLDHSEVASATMARAADPGECDKRSLDPDDIAGLCASYSAPPRPEPEPEPSPEPTPDAEGALERDGVGGRDDDGCATGSPMPLGLAGLGLAVLRAIAVRSARRASGGCRPTRRPSRARS